MTEIFCGKVVLLDCNDSIGPATIYTENGKVVKVEKGPFDVESLRKTGLKVRKPTIAILIIHVRSINIYEIRLRILEIFLPCLGLLVSTYTLPTILLIDN